MPNFLSKDAHNLLRALFKKVPETRLGYGLNGHEDVKRHEFFSSINWQKLYRREIKPPFKPEAASDLTAHFDSQYTDQVPTGKHLIVRTLLTKSLFRLAS
jgi:p90 ribosomal S6 kinase